MKQTTKIYEIDCIEKGHLFSTWNYSSRRRSGRHRLRWVLSDEFRTKAFTPAQLAFLDSKTWTARPHPRHSPVIEIFVDAAELEPKDYTLLGLLF